MPFTLIHGLISFLAAFPFTKDRRLLLLAFLAGMMPDLDGIPVLFDRELFYALHHELLNPLIYAVLFGLVFALALSRFAKMDFKKSFAVFAASYALHPLTDAVFTDWPVKLLWPLSNTQYSWPVLLDYNAALALLSLILSIAAVVVMAGKRGQSVPWQSA
ncbi:MAG: metal-dependent hydrolase [Candidatus Diapherotrites archaeon]|uniref:Metal-dependent hydrolase n=1 Tax=Candidatus Iainarchaeum sp. TaxID=3101447 RepID=A0A8T3YRE8_9ARCH|nr:metal-dependent hydrolase [Candidatus Diapherotrites archaeon]